MFSRNNIILSKVFLKLDYRNSEDSGTRKLTGMIITYLFINTMLSLGNFQKFELNSFIFSSLTLNLFLIGFVIVSDYADLFFSPKHTLSLASLPIKEENIFVSKISSAFIYLSIYPFVVSFPPAVYVYFYNYSISESLLFVFISFLFSYFIIGFIFLVNSIIIIRSKTKNRILIFFMQILFVFFIFSMNKYSANNASDLLNLSYIKYLPQYYLLLGFYNVYYLLIFVIVTLLLFVFIYIFLKHNYSRISGLINTIASPSKRRGFLSLNLEWLNKIILRNNLEAASFNLIKNHLRNTSTLKFRLIPLLFLPIVATVITVFSGLNEILFLSIMTNTSLLVISPAISMTFIVSSRILLTNLVIGFDEDENISSLYSSLPVKSRYAFNNGIIKFVYFYFIIPVLFLCGLIITFKIQSVDIVFNFLYIFFFIVLINTVFAKLYKLLPFSVPVSKFNNSSKYLQILVSILLGIVFIISQIFIFANFIFFIIAIFVILLIIVFLNKIYK
ncbi:MAG: hypothetical protein WC139_00735 [Candidatus Kapaibacterium sp.]